MKHILLFVLFLFGNISGATVSREESIASATVVGKWLSKITSHHDHLSATPVATKRAGKKFFIIGKPAKQNASDYGISSLYAPLTDSVLAAYQVLGQDTAPFPKYLQLTRINLALGFNNLHDFTFSYLKSSGDISGWGIGYKKVIIHYGPFYMSYRFKYSQSQRVNYFFTRTFTTDFSISLYFRLIDLYAGVRHSMGQVEFDSTIDQLKIPRIDYIDKIDDLEYFYGTVLALTTNTRLTLELHKRNNEYSMAAKLSLHFDSLLPRFKNLFRDPRYIRH